MSKQLLSIWQKFEQQSLVDAPLQQKVEMQKAFYMGASALLSVLKTIPDDASEEAGVEVFEGLDQECKAYLEQAAADYDRNRGRGFGNKGGRT